MTDLGPLLDGQTPACADADPDYWFPDDRYDDPAWALAICHDCPAQQPCLDYALTNDVEGIWGATTRRERTTMRRRQRGDTRRPDRRKSTADLLAEIRAASERVI